MEMTKEEHCEYQEYMRSITPEPSESDYFETQEEIMPQALSPIENPYLASDSDHSDNAAPSKWKEGSKGKFMDTFKLFLTYPGHINAEAFVAWISAKIPKTNKLKQYTIAHEVGWTDLEKHPEGYKHTHMLIVFEKSYAIKTPRTLDYQGVHGDYMRAKTLPASHRYLLKGDVDIEACEEQGIDWKNATKDMKLPRLAPVYFTNVEDIDDFKGDGDYGNRNRSEARLKAQMDALLIILKKCRTLDEALASHSALRISDHNQIAQLWRDIRQTNDYTNGQAAEEARAVVLRPWQQDIYDLCKSGSDGDRRITWVHDFDGNSGKSALTRVIKHTMPELNILTYADTGRVGDLALPLSKYCETLGAGPDIVIFDVSRAREDNSTLYTFMEQLKNGEVLSTKYVSRQVTIMPPRIIVFANFYPNLDGCSLDRWCIKNVVLDSEGEYRLQRISVKKYPSYHEESVLRKRIMEQRRERQVYADREARAARLLALGYTSKEIKTAMAECIDYSSD